MLRVAALITSHNRVERTVSCLEALTRQVGANFLMDIVLCDAGSIDGTADTVRRRFPSTTVISATDDVYWNGGMYRSFAHAIRYDYDFYLWVNDDTVLDRHAVSLLLSTHSEVVAIIKRPAIIVGAVRDPVTGRLTYGGVVRRSLFRPFRFSLVPTADKPVGVETMNGNCVLISRSVVRKVGLLDPLYTHGMGDFDYGFRARAMGVSILVAPGTLGECARNPEPPAAFALQEHIVQLTRPKGIPPREWSRFARRWGGPFWPMYIVSPFVRQTAKWLFSRVRNR